VSAVMSTDPVWYWYCRFLRKKTEVRGDMPMVGLPVNR